MKRLLDFNPLSGEKVWFDYDRNDQMVLTHEQDVSRHLEYAHARMVDTDYTKKGIKNDLWHYAKVPNTVMIEMKQKHGVDMMCPDPDWKAIFRCINAHYPWLKTTDKMHQ